MVAAIFVDGRGVYGRLAGELGVEVWDAARDARRYPGSAPVVAHPPCARWGRYAAGGPSHHGRFTPGDDGGCFASALASVRAWGGVLEHPAGSHAWAAHGLVRPPRAGGWVSAGDWLGWTCEVEQGHYGHLARKRTWLYAARVELPALAWGPSVPPEHGRRIRPRSASIVEVWSRRQREATPEAFARVLLAIAGGAR